MAKEEALLKFGRQWRFRRVLAEADVFLKIGRRRRCRWVLAEKDALPKLGGWEQRSVAVERQTVCSGLTDIWKAVEVRAGGVRGECLPERWKAAVVQVDVGGRGRPTETWRVGEAEFVSGICF